VKVPLQKRNEEGRKEFYIIQTRFLCLAPTPQKSCKYN